MVTNVSALSVTATGSTTKRGLGDRLADVLNVRDFGAVGNGTTDDTAAIQACFNAAYGTWAAPHGGDQNLGSPQFTNKAVFFPAGRYLVTPAINNRAVTGAINHGDGRVRLTVSTTGLATGDPVNIAGVVGTTAANGLWFVDVVDATHLVLRFSAFAGTYTSGGTLTTPCLRLRMVQGGNIYGAGRMSTFITSRTANASTLVTNGFSYSQIRSLSFSTALNGTCLQLDWTDPDVSATTALQSNTVADCHFGGIAGDGSPRYGITVGAGVRMGSEMLFLNNFAGGFTGAGIWIGNYNALSISVVGGNISTCAIGIHVAQGSATMIHGVAFQNQTDCDIYVENAAEEAYTISGCRSESLNFLRTGPAWPYNVTGCSHSREGYFFSGAGFVTISNCKASLAYLESYNCNLDINNCVFGNVNYLTGGVAAKYAHCRVFPQRVTEQTGAAYTIVSADDSSKIRFNRATAQTVTVDPAFCGLTAGAKIEVQQVGAGQVTFVGVTAVIRSSNGLKLRAQYSCATLTCDGTNLWTLTGDTAP